MGVTTEKAVYLWNFNSFAFWEVYTNVKDFKFKIDFKQEIKTQDDIDALIEMLDYILSLVKVVA